MRKIDSRECHLSFGRFIKQRRELLKLQQKEIAEKVGITQPYLSYIERGERDIDLPLALNLCEALELDINEFVKNYL